MKGCSKKTRGGEDNLCERFDSYCKKVIYHAAYNCVQKEVNYYRRFCCEDEQIDSELGQEDNYLIFDSVRWFIDGHLITVEDEGLARGLMRLNKRRREIVLRSFWMEMSLNEIAEVMNLQYETAKSDKSKAIRRLRKELRKENEKEE